MRVPDDEELFTFYPALEMDAAELIRSRGYPCEEHVVRTDDGFLLVLYRIPHGRMVPPAAAGDRPRQSKKAPRRRPGGSR